MTRKLSYLMLVLVLCTGCRSRKGTVLLLNVEPEIKEQGISDILDKYDLTIVYDYENFSMYAVKADHVLTDQETEQLIRELEEEPGILGAEKDQTMEIQTE